MFPSLFSGHQMLRHYLNSHEKEKTNQTKIPIRKRSNIRSYRNQSSMIGKVENLKKCPICGQMKTRKTMRKHLEAHSVVSKHVCPICPFNYNQINELKLHIVKKHPDNYEPVNQFICTFCPDKTVFEHVNNLRSHMEDDHNIKQIPRKKYRKSNYERVGDLTRRPMQSLEEILQKKLWEKNLNDMDE